jgi:DNA-binding GntR family transcriptional regulator
VRPARAARRGPLPARQSGCNKRLRGALSLIKRMIRVLATDTDRVDSSRRSINRLSGSRKIIAALKVVSLDIPREFLIHLPQRIARSNDDHELVLRAFRAPDPDSANEILKQHVIGAGEALIALLEDRGVRVG